MNGVAVSFLNPKSVLDQTDISAGYRVADFGAGSGHFTLEASRRVGDTGVVYAIDVLASALETIQGGAKVEGLGNISCIRANLENEQGSKLEENSLDMVMTKDILFQNDDKKSIIREASRVLKSGGILLVVEWSDHHRTIGPDVSARIGEKELEILIEEGGFTIEKTIPAGDYHYAFTARKK